MQDGMRLKELVSLTLSKPVEGKLELRGKVELEVRRRNGQVEKMEFSNTITNDLLWAVANALGDGTMAAVNAIDFYYSAAWDHEQATSIDGGGTGAEAWIRWQATLTAAGTITVTPVRLGIETAGTWTTTYSEVAITAVALSSGDSLIVKWTITAAVS